MHFVFPKDIKLQILSFLHVRDRLKCLQVNKDLCCIVTESFSDYTLPGNWLDTFYYMASETYSTKYVEIPNIKLWYQLPWNLCWTQVELMRISDDYFEVQLHSKSKDYDGKNMFINLKYLKANKRDRIAPVFVPRLFMHFEAPKIVIPNFIEFPYASDYWCRNLVDVHLHKFIWDEALKFAHFEIGDNFITTHDICGLPKYKNFGWICGVVDWCNYDKKCNPRQVPVWVDVTQCLYSSHNVSWDAYLDVLHTGDSVWIRIYVFLQSLRISRFGAHTSVNQQCTVLATPLFTNNLHYNYKTAKFLQKPSLIWSDIVDSYVIDSPNLEWDFLLNHEINSQNVVCVRQHNGLLCLGCFIAFGNEFWLITDNNEKFPIDSTICENNKLLTMVYKGKEMYKNNIICVSIDEYNVKLSNNNNWYYFWNDWLTVEPLATKMGSFIPLRMRIPYFFLNTRNNNNNNTYEWVGNNEKSPKIYWDAWSHMLSIPINTTTWHNAISYDNADDIRKQNGCIGVWIDITDAIAQINIKLWKYNPDFITNKQKTKVFGKFYALFEGSDEITKL